MNREFNLDVIVCYLKTDNQAWLNDLENDLQNEPVNYKFIEVMPGNVAKSRQLAFEASSADHVSFFDSDDRVVPGAFAKMMALVKPTSSVILSNEHKVDIDLKPLGDPTAHVDFSLRELLSDAMHGHSVRVFNRQLLGEIIYDIRGGKVFQDLDILVRLTDLARSTGMDDPVFLPDATRLWRQRPNSACHTVSTYDDWAYRLALFDRFYMSKTQYHEGDDVGASRAEILSRFRY